MMKKLLSFALILSLTPWLASSAPAGSPAGYSSTGVDKEPTSLPKYMTEEEKLIPFDKPSRDDFRFRAPPTGSVYCPAEYEACEGLFIAWEGYTTILTELTVGITTADEETKVFVVVDTSSEQTSAYSSLNSAGADMDQVEFIVRTTDTVWIRDYGPRFIFEDGDRAIIDHTYNRPRPNDNTLNDYISALWEEPHYDIPLTHGGGNFHLFSNGDAFMTDLIFDENPGLSEQDVKDLYSDYQNVDLTIYPGFPTYFDSTQHIDMWMLPMGDDKIIIGQYDSGTGLPYTITEDAVDDLESRGYTVYRTPGWNPGGTHYTYTNAVILNDLIFVPTFNGYSTENAQAQAVFAEALPDHTLITVNCSSIIGAAGAIHCIVMHVPLPGGGVALTLTLPDGTPWLVEPGVDTPITVQIQDGSESYVPGSGMIHYRFDDGVFLTGTLTPLGGDLYEAILPAADCDSTPEFYFSATGDGGTTIYSPEDAPASFYSAMVGTLTTIMYDDFETDQGWTIENVELIHGEWERGVPVGDGSYGDPVEDFDGSGQCYLTENLAGNSDVDGGPTRLISPTLDLSQTTDPILRYARWFSNDDLDADRLDVEISDDNGDSWVLIESLPDFDGWVQASFHASDFINLTDQVKVRFSATDNPNNSFTEAAIDTFEVFEIACASLKGDYDGDGVVDLEDFSSFPACMTGPDNGPTNEGCDVFDFEDDNDVDLEDFAAFQRAFNG